MAGEYPGIVVPAPSHLSHLHPALVFSQSPQGEPGPPGQQGNPGAQVRTDLLLHRWEKGMEFSTSLAPLPEMGAAI